MESRKTHLNFKPHELYMNLSPLTICSCLIFVTSVTVAFDYVSFVHDASREICPYTNFCQTNASMTLKDDEVSCCLPCSCSDNCAEMNGDCCPDKTVRIKLAPLAKCKAVIVKRKIGDSRRYDGYSYNVPRYRVVDTCLGDENNLTLVADCEGNKSTIEHFLWVSDKTGRIFDNRFCALCNGLDSDEIVVWGLRTSCISVLKSNYFSLSATLLSNQCDIRLELPSKEAHVIQNARCFTPSISRCNQTGHWDHHNSSIETACATFDSPVLYFPPDDGRKGANVHLVKIFKNLYCVACNERTSRSPSPLCPQIKPTDGRKQFSTFSILVDYVHVRSAKEGLQDKDDEKKHCATDEVRDSYKVGSCFMIILLLFYAYGRWKTWSSSNIILFRLFVLFRPVCQF